jgi:hypothetical protein
MVVMEEQAEAAEQQLAALTTTEVRVATASS